MGLHLDFMLADLIVEERVAAVARRSRLDLARAGRPARRSWASRLLRFRHAPAPCACGCRAAAAA